MKKDYLLAIIAGIFTALFLLPTFKNITILEGALAFLPIVLIPLLWVIGLSITKFLVRWVSFAYQFGKFIVVGFLNSSLDFGILNALSIFTGLTSGFFIGGVNIPGVILATTNSYFWNKFWVFRKNGEPRSTDYSDFFSFIPVVIISIFINGGIIILITTYVSPFWNLSPERWLNVAKVIATSVSLFWNFLAFKFFVFKSKKNASTISKIQTEEV
ncbi:GtrA family protein [Patescibacteria group bacterium]